MKATVYVGTSLDGFIARADGGIDWLLGADELEEKGEDYGFKEFFDTVDAMVMGRNTYELALSFGEWPYGDKLVFVLSSRGVEIPEKLRRSVEWMNGTPAEVVRKLEERGVGHIYVDGGNTVQRFLAAGLIQRMVITRLPVLIGTGISLFGPVPHDIRCRHVGTTTYLNGFVKSEYEVIGGPAVASDPTGTRG